MDVCFKTGNKYILIVLSVLNARLLKLETLRVLVVNINKQTNGKRQEYNFNRVNCGVFKFKGNGSHITINNLLIRLSAGQYCIYKRGTCPNDLTRGSVFWDDDNLRNGNSKSGILPGGTYNRNTQINFCCKTRGNKASAVLLPSQSPFYLLAYKSAKCQTVMWTVANLEWIHYDTEHSNNNDRAIQSYPYEAGKQHPTIYYCHYRGTKPRLLECLLVFSYFRLSNWY